MHRIEALRQFSQQLLASNTFNRVQVNDDRYIFVRTSANENVVIYFVDAPLSNNAIKQALRDNTMRGIFSLFVLDINLLPRHEEVTTLHPFAQTIQTLFHGKVYAYGFENEVLTVFPVQLRTEEGTSARKMAIYGTSVMPVELTCGHVETSFPLQGFWGTVNFKTQVEYETPKVNNQHYSYSRGEHIKDKRKTDQDAFDRLQRGGVRKEHYALLGLAVNATEMQVKSAYRRLARRFHPDLNGSPEAKVRMQEINLAYKELMRQFE